MHVSGVLEGQKRVSDLELELKMLVSHRVDARNSARALTTFNS